MDQCMIKIGMDDDIKVGDEAVDIWKRWSEYKRIR